MMARVTICVSVPRFDERSVVAAIKSEAWGGWFARGARRTCACGGALLWARPVAAA